MEMSGHAPAALPPEEGVLGEEAECIPDPV
jgi:hypothetical protein